jgi:hypothetical protein
MFAYAQFTLTKDLSFGNNGIVQLDPGFPSANQLGNYNTPRPNALKI